MMMPTRRYRVTTGKSALAMILALATTCAGFMPFQASGTEVGQPWTIPGLELELMPVPAGSFTMGSPESEEGRDDDEKQHPVRITRPFWMGRHEVTQAQWKAIMGTTAEQQRNIDISERRGELPYHGYGQVLHGQAPMVWVNWLEARDFCAKVDRREREAGRIPDGYKYRLPTEAEWEYACRAGTTTSHHSGNSPDALHEVAWYAGNSGRDSEGVADFEVKDGTLRKKVKDPSPYLRRYGRGISVVGGKKPNAWGLHDMHGNASEWCLDWYGEYGANEAIDPFGPSTQHWQKVARGGSWGFQSRLCRSAQRNRYPLGSRSCGLGFRVVLAPVIADTGAASPLIVPSTPTIAGPGPQAGQAWTIADLGMDLLPVPAGTFQRGSDSGDEKPVHEVRISRPYWLGKYEVTQAQWQAVMGNNPSNFKSLSRPVEQVSWNDCVEFCRKLTERERAAGRLPAGYVYRLPTEAEWEYAARGGDKSQGYKYSGSNDLDEVGWYKDNSDGKTRLVGQKKPNELGLYDMSGNVYEWCHDGYDAHPSGSVTDPQGASDGSLRVLRSSSWFNDAFTLACRTKGSLSGNSDIVGFRVSLAPPVQSASSPPESLPVPEANVSPEDIGAVTANATPPAIGQAWTVPDLGLEFVWIPALNCWVGKYEVTNGEYRQFVPGHDSKDFEGHSLNGDPFRQN